jgi:hypothetical protein
MCFGLCHACRQSSARQTSPEVPHDAGSGARARQPAHCDRAGPPEVTLSALKRIAPADRLDRRVLTEEHEQTVLVARADRLTCHPGLGRAGLVSVLLAPETVQLMGADTEVRRAQVAAVADHASLITRDGGELHGVTQRPAALITLRADRRVRDRALTYPLAHGERVWTAQGLRQLPDGVKSLRLSFGGDSLAT